MKIKIFIHTTGQLPSQHWLTASLPYLIHKGSYLPDEIADYMFN